MPLHVDRSTVQSHLHHQVAGHVMDRAGARAPQGPNAAGSEQPEATSVLRLAAPAPSANDVASVNEAEKLVRTLISTGGRTVLAAHGSLDPTRVASLLRG